jgi:hypothetical protein
MLYIENFCAAVTNILVYGVKTFQNVSETNQIYFIV